MAEKNSNPILALIEKNRSGSSDLEKAIATANTKELNISSPGYLQDVKRIIPELARPEFGGYFERSKPGIININPRSMFNVLNTLAHEAAHSSQHEFTKWRDAAISSGDYPNNTNVLGIAGNTVGRVNTHLDRQLRERLPEIEKKYESQYQLGAGFSTNNKELMANLAGIEATLPKGYTLLDTDIGKDLFNTKELKQWYLQSSLPNTVKMTEREPTLYETVLDKVQELFKGVK